MSIALISSSKQLSTQLKQILSEYFDPSPKTKQIKQPSNQDNQTSKLKIDTKYYQCNVQICTFLIEDIPMETSQKQYNAVFIVLNHDQISNKNKDLIKLWMNKLNVDSATIIINIKQQNIQESCVQQLMQQFDSFVLVMQVNLQQLISNPPPKNNKNGLLSNDDESPIYQIFDMLQTTEWPNIIKKNPNLLNNTKKITQNHNDKQKQDENGDQKIQKIQHMQQDNQNDLEYDEEKLQSQMMQFQNLMRQMMDIKLTTQNNNQRKKKAEDVILKLVGKMNNI